MVPRTPSAGENGGSRPARAFDERDVGDYVCALVGFVVAVAGVAVVYPVVPTADHPFGFLAMTALVCLFVLAWLAAWTCAGAVWTRRTRRANGS